MWSYILYYLLSTSVGCVRMTALYLRMNPNGGFVGRPCGVGIDLSSILYGVRFFDRLGYMAVWLCALLYRARKERQWKQSDRIPSMSY